MHKIEQMLVVLTVLTIAACSAIRVNQDYEMATNFNNYRTFDLEPVPIQRSGDILMDSPFIDQRITMAIENTLALRDYQKTSDFRPDFNIKYQLAVRTRIEIDTFPAYGWLGYSCGYRHCYDDYPYWNGFGYETYVDQYDELTLIIDFWDSNTGKLFWRGTGSRRMYRQLPPEEMTEWIHQLVFEILNQYPPLPPAR